MTQDEKKRLLSAQQGELNAVLMYRKFASITKDEKLKKIFLEAAADEGRHASLLAKYTEEKLQPKNTMANLLGIMYRVLPKKIIFFAMYKGEYAGGDGYKPLLDKYPEFEDMRNDEYRHGNTFKNLM